MPIPASNTFSRSKPNIRCQLCQTHVSNSTLTLYCNLINDPTVDTKDIDVETLKVGDLDRKGTRFKQKKDSIKPTYFKFEIQGSMVKFTIADPGSGVFEEKFVELAKIGPDSTMRIDMSLFIH